MFWGSCDQMKSSGVSNKEEDVLLITNEMLVCTGMNNECGLSRANTIKSHFYGAKLGLSFKV